MIVKGKPRSGPAQLAAYLMRVDDGEHPTLLHLDYGDDNLRKAFIEWDSIGELTRGEKTLYHAQIAPDAKYQMTPEQWERAAQILAEELGMKDHPFAAVLHDGGDKPHLHVVFQRADTETMKLWDDSYNYVKHESASKRMELEFDHELVPGKHAKRDREKQPEFPREKMSQDEAQQEKRTGLNADDRKAEITALHAAADGGQAFKAALEEAGYLLAKGERGYLVVDQAGGHTVLSRNIKGLKQKDVEAFMAGVELDKLPTIEEAKAIQKQRLADAKTEPPVEAQKQAPEASKLLPPEPAQNLEQPTPAPAKAEEQPKPNEVPPPAPEKPAQPPEDPELQALKKAIEELHAKEVRKWADLHALELRQLEYDLTRLNAGKADDFAAIQAVEMAALKDRQKQHRTGIQGVLDAIQSKLNPTLAAEKAKEQRREIAQLKARQAKERTDYLALIEQTKQLEIENLKERQALKRSDVERKHEEGTEQYIREHHEAKRILAEIEAKRIHEELEKKDNFREGPPPPKMGK